MSRSLPPRPDLERLRREARALQRACLAGETQALVRLDLAFATVSGRELPLTRAQFVIAREYGFASWPALAHEVRRRRAPAAKSADELDAEALAERWFALAQADDLRALARALAVGKRRKQRARAAMQAAPARYAGFQTALLAGLQSRRARTRFECAGALDTFGDAAARPALTRLIDDPVPRVRWMAMHALSCHACGETGGALEPYVRARIVAAAFADPSPQVRRHAAVALALAAERGAAPVLREMLERETDAKLLRGGAWAYAELTRAPKAATAPV